MNEVKGNPVDSSFSTFMFGLTLGVIGTLLLSTEEGRRVSRQILIAVSTGIEKNADLLDEAKEMATKAVTSVTKYTDSLPYLPDQPTSVDEAPPPPPPYLNRAKGSPSYFTSDAPKNELWS